jgi:thiamine biosynthesis protein ThiS
MECNGQIISRSNFSIMYIKDGDKLEIVGAVGGG